MESTKADRQNKRCFVCGQGESDHPGGRFCQTKQEEQVDNTENTITIELTDKELTVLTYALGIAAGAISDNKQMLHAFINLADKVHANDKHWTPYGIPQI